MEKNIKRRRINWFRLMVAVIILYGVYMGVVQQRQLDAIRAETEASHKQMEQLQQENAQLQEKCKLLNDPKYIEKVAREELGMAKPGEVPYMSAGKN